MGESAVIKKNSFYYFISSASRLVANSLIFIIIGRIYGPESFGSFTTAHTFSAIFLLFADFGFDILITTEIARNKNNFSEIIRKYFPIKLFFTSLSFMLFLIVTFFVPVSDESKIFMFIFAFHLVFTTLLNMVYSSFRGLEQFKYEAVISSVTNFSLLLLVAYFSYHQYSLPFMAMFMVLTKASGLVIGVLIFKDRISFKSIFSKKQFLFSDIKLVLIFGLHLIFGTIFFQIDSVLILIILGEYQAGLYQAVFKLLMIALLIPDILVGAILPTVTRLFSVSDKKGEQISAVLFKFLFAVSLPVAFFMFFFPRDILLLVYNKIEYLESSVILQAAALILVARYSFETFGMRLTVKNKQFIRTMIVIAVSIINIILNIIFIPSYGIKASILISLASNLLAGMLYSYFTKDEFIFCINDLRLMIPVLTMAIYTVLFYSFNPEFWVSITFVLISYPALLQLYFPKSEREFLFRLKTINKV